MRLVRGNRRCYLRAHVEHAPASLASAYVSNSCHPIFLCKNPAVCVLNRLSSSSWYISCNIFALSAVNESSPSTSYSLATSSLNCSSWLIFGRFGRDCQSFRRRRARHSFPSCLRNSSRLWGSGWYEGGSERRRGMKGRFCAPETLASKICRREGQRELSGVDIRRGR